MTAPLDLRRDALTAFAEDFLRTYDLHPDPAAYLAQGFVDLALAAWRGSVGERLDLATRWALWMWLADDHVDSDLQQGAAADALVMRLLEILLDEQRSSPTDHPCARALEYLVGSTTALMPRAWWIRYRDELAEWLQAAVDKRHSFVLPGRTPSLREYLAFRPVDGGMKVAAMWTELALDCVSPDWTSYELRCALDAFSAVGTLLNDLAALDSDTITAQAALAHSARIPLAEARQEISRLIDAQKRLFWVQEIAITDDADRGGEGALAPETALLVRGCGRFLQALSNWTRSSSRYADEAASQLAVAR